MSGARGTFEVAAVIALWLGLAVPAFQEREESEAAPAHPRSVYEATATFENGEVFSIRRHLGAVLERLRNRDVSDLSEEQRANRMQHIERLAAYRDEGIFPHNHTLPGLAPVFIDEGGRACAVGHLMIESGAAPLAREIARLQENAYVPDLDVPGAADWIASSGLSAEECALIQPSYGGCKTPCAFGSAWDPNYAVFKAHRTRGAAPVTVRFLTGWNYVNMPTSWSWDFGDGGTSNLQNPTHTYTNPGIYTISLTVNNSIVSDTFTRTDYIEVRALFPDFRGTPTSGGAPLTVGFEDLSSNSPTGWSWNFGDGATSSLQDPIHEYSAPGTYTVSLTATNALGSGTKTRVGYIQVLPVEAAFSATPRNGGTPLTVTFTDLSSNSPTDWSWDFGDGGTSNLQNPTHTYTNPGIYTVALTASNEQSSDTESRANYIEVDLVLTEFANLVANDAAVDDKFGSSTALLGDLALVGAPADDHLGGTDAGAAYVLEHSAGSWSEVVKLVASDSAAGDAFGVSVALDGDRAIVGASDDDHGGGTDAGSAYVFVRNGSTWTEEAKLVASDATLRDRFGTSVSLRGDRAIVGAIRSGGGGAAYVFVRNGTGWTEEARLVGSLTTSGDQLGSAVAHDADTVLVGAQNSDNTGVAEAYVFVRDGTTWSQQARLVAPGAIWFGGSVALDGDTAIVGASYENGRGGAYVFVRAGTTWSLQTRLTAPEPTVNARFGGSVALDGDWTVIGAHLDDTGVANSGSAYVFVRDGTEWNEQARLNASDAWQLDQFGFSVTLDGDAVLVGARLDDHMGGVDAGSVYAYGLGASVVTRNGSAVNPVALLADGPPRLGETWTPYVSTLQHPGATLSVLVVHALPATGPILGSGELLVDLASPRLVRSLVVSSPTGLDEHPLEIPADQALIGVSASCQAAIFGSAGTELTSALDIRIGR